MSILGKSKPTLSVERIKAFQDELETYIDERAAQIKKMSPGIPLMVCRNLITARSGGCACLGAIHILENIEADEELKAQQKAAKA